MTKNYDALSMLTSKPALAFTLALAAVIGIHTSANAQIATGSSGTFRTAVCAGSTPQNHIILLTPGTGGGHTQTSSNATAQDSSADGASSNFVTLTGDQAAGGFGLTSAGAQLSTNGTGGTAGLNVRLSYPTVSAGDTANDYIQTQFNYSTTGPGAKGDTIVKFCFQTNDGTGDVITSSIKLNQLTPISQANGFQRVAVGSINGLNVNTMVLRKISFQLSNNKGRTNSVTIGEVQVYTNSGVFDPVGINLNSGTCKSLSTCPASNAGTVED